MKGKQESLSQEVTFELRLQGTSEQRTLWRLRDRREGYVGQEPEVLGMRKTRR